MAEPTFPGLHRRLIRGGISPWRVGRILQELRDHHFELALEYKRAGSAHPVDDALARLGTEDSLAQQFLAQPELLSWSRRWPWAVYVLAPLLLFPAAFAATIAIMVGLIGLAHVPAGHPVPPPLLEALRVVRLFNLYALPVIAASGFALLARRRGVSRVWVWTTIGLLAVLGALPNMEVTAHQIGAGVGFATRPVFLVRFLLERWLPTAASATLLYWMVLHIAQRMHFSDARVASPGAQS